MSVLTLAGKPINWANAPKPTTRVMWSKRDMYGRKVTGSLRTIAHLDHLDTLAMKKFNAGVVVIQPPFNTTVKASEGTHDFDKCSDIYIPGVGWREQERFFRANGYACWWRRPPAFGHHIHGFTLPPREGVSISDDFAVAGFKVGKYVDGGHSLYGRQITSSQIEDYYAHRTGLSGHAKDTGSWFPPNITATIFDLPAYVRRQRKAARPAKKGDDEIVNLNSHAPLARLGGEAGAALWRQWEGNVRSRANRRVRQILSVLFTMDTNKHGALPNFGAGLRRIGGRGIDLIGFRRAAGGASIKVLKRKTVNLHIDGHDCHGVRLRARFPSGLKVTFWLVHANIGRGTEQQVRNSLIRIRKAFGAAAVYNFNEIDEADVPKETRILREVFPKAQFRPVGMGTRCVTLVGRKKLKVRRGRIFTASRGMAKVSPHRVVIETTLAPK